MDLNEFPEKIALSRVGSEEIIHLFYLPTSGPEMKCETSKLFGGGKYKIQLLKADGQVMTTTTFEITNMDNKCPFTNHC